MKKIVYFNIILLFQCFLINSWAHPGHESKVLLTINDSNVIAEIHIPLSELEFSFGHKVSLQTNDLMSRLKPELTNYLLGHCNEKSIDGQMWSNKVIFIGNDHKELIVYIEMTPSSGNNTRTFWLYYDAVVHILNIHKVIVAVRKDWGSGQIDKNPVEIGFITYNPKIASVPPLKVSLGSGNDWKGFLRMIKMGIDHIAEGTDHLLFLLTLLLPAPLLIIKKHWAGFGGWRYSIFRLIKIATAFTIGHSLTLLIGADGLLRLPSQPIEALIALSIMVSSVHAFRPIFPNKEMYIAIGFGLVHGMAFAGSLYDLQLGTYQMGLAILGFNLGIEAMQMFVILTIVPVLILLSKTRAYPYIRIVGSFLSFITASVWLVQRIVG